MKSRRFSSIALVALFLAVGGCGRLIRVGNDHGMSQVDVLPPVGSDTFQIQDIVEIEDHTIVLNEVDVRDSRLTADFTIKNQGNDDLRINASQFIARNDGNNRVNELEQIVFYCYPSIGGRILPGEIMQGKICWTGLLTEGAKIYYESAPQDSEAIVWEIGQ